jgi:hypothetical protein
MGSIDEANPSIKGERALGEMKVRFSGRIFGSFPGQEGGADAAVPNTTREQARRPY